MELFYDILKQLVRVPCVVGSEHPFFLNIMRELEALNVQVEYYDGVLVARGSKPTSGYLSAHADRHGLVCTGHNEFQYAAFIAKNQADLLGNSNSEKWLKNFEMRFVNQKVQAYQPWSGAYLGMGTIKETFLCARRNNILFKVDGFDYLFPGTPIAFMDKLEIAEDGLISAQLDNVISVAMIVYLYNLGYQGTAFFTASEEAGKSWRFLLEYFNRFDHSTDELLVLDTSPYGKIEEIQAIDIVLRKKDENAKFTSPLNRRLKKISTKLGVRFQYKDEYLLEKMKKNNTKDSLGVTELGRIIHATKGRIQGTTLQLPTIGYHTAEESTYRRNVDAAVAVLSELYGINNTKGKLWTPPRKS